MENNNVNVNASNGTDENPQQGGVQHPIQPGNYPPGGYAQGGYPQGGYPPQGGFQQPLQAQPMNSQIPPNSGMVKAILSTLFCCLPLGIVSIVYASKVNGLWISGNHAAAMDAANSSKSWSTWAIISGLVIFVVYIILAVAGVGIGLNFLPH